MRWFSTKIAKTMVGFGLAASLCAPMAKTANAEDAPRTIFKSGFSTSFAAYKADKKFSAQQLAKLIDKAPKGADIYLGDQHDITADAEIVFTRPVLKALQKKKVSALALEVPVEFQPVIDDLKKHPDHLDQAIKKFLYAGFFLNDSRNLEDRVLRARSFMEGVLLAQKHGIDVQATDTIDKDAKEAFNKRLLKEDLSPEQRNKICEAITYNIAFAKERMKDVLDPEFTLQDSPINIAKQTNDAAGEAKKSAINTFNELLPGYAKYHAAEAYGQMFLETRVNGDHNRVQSLNALRKKEHPLAVYYGGIHCYTNYPTSMAAITQGNGIPVYAIQLTPALTTTVTNTKLGPDGKVQSETRTTPNPCSSDACFDVYNGDSVRPGQRTQDSSNPSPKNG